jgi:hypothetical protein
MATTNLSSITVRFEKAAKTLSIPKEDLIKTLNQNDIGEDEEGLKYLNSKVITIDLLEGILKNVSESVIKIKAAALFLKGEDPFEEEEKADKQEDSKPIPESNNSSADAVIKYIEANRPIEQLSDKQLLEMWSSDRDFNKEQELSLRSKGQPFIVLKPGSYEPGKEEIDIEMSIDLLKASRRRTNPTIIPYGDNSVADVYRITDLNLNDRIIEICPMCGAVLYKGFCSKCELSFSGINDEVRAYVKLIADSDKFRVDSFSDRKAVHASATKGLEDLIKTWPSIRRKFEELKVSGNLPTLRQIMDRPAKRIADPFNISGNRSF